MGRSEPNRHYGVALRALESLRVPVAGHTPGGIAPLLTDEPDVLNSTVTAAVAERVTAEPSRGPRRRRRNIAVVTRLQRVLAAAREHGEETALLALAAVNGDREAVDTLRLLLAEPVAGAADKQLMVTALEQLEARVQASSEGRVTIAHGLLWTGWLNQAMQANSQPDRAPELVAVCRELLALVHELAHKPAQQRLVLLRLLRAQLQVAAVRVASLPPPPLAPPRRVLVGAVEQCAPPALAADVTHSGHVAAVAA